MDEFLNILRAYAVTFGWALVGAVSMGIALLLMLKIFTWSTKEVDEWQLIKENNVSMAIVLAAVIIAAGIVVACCILPS